VIKFLFEDPLETPSHLQNGNFLLLLILHKCKNCGNLEYFYGGASYYPQITQSNPLPNNTYYVFLVGPPHIPSSLMMTCAYVTSSYGKRLNLSLVFEGNTNLPSFLEPNGSN
jgi:hypothetical protein